MNNNKYDHIVWSDTFLCGIKIIDNQHKTLINMINEMFTHITGSEKEEKDYLFDTVHIITEYIKMHFSTEEKFMAATKYEDYSKHKKIHDTFILDFIDSVNNFLCTSNVTLYSFTSHLEEWILTHITSMDKNYIAYCREIATKKADEIKMASSF